MRQPRIFIQAAKDILDVNDRIIDQFSHGDRQSPEGHHVDRDSAEIKHQSRNDDRQGDCR